MSSREKIERTPVRRQPQLERKREDHYVPYCICSYFWRYRHGFRRFRWRFLHLYELAISSVLMMGNVPDSLRANTRKDFRAAMAMTSDEDRAWAHRRNMDRVLEQLLQGP